MIHIPEEYPEFQEVVDLSINKKNTMYTLNWTNVKSAMTYAILGGIGGAVLYTIRVHDLFLVEGHAIINAAYFGGVAVVGSLVKNFFTNDDGEILGITKVAEAK